MQNIIVATKQEEIAKVLEKTPDFNIIGYFKNSKELDNNLQDILSKAEVVLATEDFECSDTSIYNYLINLHNKYKVRIVYLMGNEATSGIQKMLKKMVENGIYDILIGSELEFTKVVNLIKEPRSLGDVEEILTNSGTEEYPNIFTVYSLKPGVGKTTLATNLAVAIAKYGDKKRMRSGKFVDPRVLLIDGDLEKLSVSTLLRANNYDRNMLTALQRIAKEIGDGSNPISDTDYDILKNFVKSCLCRYKECDNLYIMGANTITQEELGRLSPVHFYLMVQTLVKAFDVIIIDSNSAFDHLTTAALFELSGNIFLILDNNYSNIQNNLTYIKKLADMGYDDKIKFIVNKDLTRESELSCLEDLEYDTSSIGDLVIDYRIPFESIGVLRTIDYGGNLIVTSNKADNAKKVILEIADSIWKIDNDKVASVQEPQAKPNKIVSFLNK